MFDRFDQWDEDLLRDEMLGDSTIAKTLPKPFPEKVTFNERDPNSIPSRIVANMVAGQPYEFSDVVALVDGPKTAVAAALKDLRARGLLQSEGGNTGHRRLTYRLPQQVAA